MKSNMKKILLMSVFAVQAFGSTSFATTTNDDVATIHMGQMKSLNPTSKFPCTDISTLAAITSLGLDATGLTVHDKFAGLAKTTDVTSAVSGLAKTGEATTAVIGLAKQTDLQPAATAALTAVGLTSTAVSSLAKTTDITSAVAALATADQVAALSTEVSILLPLKLTMTVDKMIESAYGNNVLTNGGYKFAGSGTLTCTDYTITGGSTSLVGLFSKTSDAVDASRLAPAQKLGIFLRTVFGITATNFQKLFNPTSTTAGNFNNASDAEDSGTVLTVVFDSVLGTDRKTPGSNKFGGTGIFGNINKAAVTTGTTSPALTTPSVYFASYFTSMGITATDKSADLARLRALLTDMQGVKQQSDS